MATSAAGAAAAIAQAIKASGIVVKVEPAEFQRILGRQPGLVVVTAVGGLFVKNHKYLTSYKGLAFFCESNNPLSLGGDCEVVAARKIWVPA